MINNDIISRQAALALAKEINVPTGNAYMYYSHWCIDPQEIEELPPISMEKIDAYKQGWHDAITAALKETHSIYTEDGPFQVVQEETLIGLGMTYKQVSTEKTGLWIKHDTGHSIYYDCSLCGCAAPCTETADKILWKLANYCPDCGAKMVESQESEE